MLVMDRLFSLKEASFILDISRQALFKRVKLGQIKAHRVGAYYAIPFEELQKWQSLPCKSGSGKSRLKKRI